MKNEIKVEPTYEFGKDNFPRFAEVNFEVWVKMFDIGQRDHFLDEQPKIPQLFKSHLRLTIGEIRTMSEHEIGMRIKMMYEQMRHHIEKYERNENF